MLLRPIDDDMREPAFCWESIDVALLAELLEAIHIQGDWSRVLTLARQAELPQPTAAEQAKAQRLFHRLKELSAPEVIVCLHEFRADPLGYLDRRSQQSAVQEEAHFIYDLCIRDRLYLHNDPFANLLFDSHRVAALSPRKPNRDRKGAGRALRQPAPLRSRFGSGGKSGAFWDGQ